MMEHPCLDVPRLDRPQLDRPQPTFVTSNLSLVVCINKEENSLTAAAAAHMRSFKRPTISTRKAQYNQHKKDKRAGELKYYLSNSFL
jgi:hypothetical protein